MKVALDRLTFNPYIMDPLIFEYIFKCVLQVHSVHAYKNVICIQNSVKLWAFSVN